MERSIGLERVFNLGDYKSLRISDYANNIPEELAFNEEFVNSLRLLQLASVDKIYYGYSVQAGILNELESDEKRVKILAEIELDLYIKLVGLMTTIIGQKESE